MNLSGLNKDSAIIDLITRLVDRVGSSALVLHPDWDADLCAIGFSRPGQHRPLVYVSTFNKPPGRYWVELESPATTDDEPYVDAGKFEDVGFEEVVTLTTHFLGLAEK